MSKHAMEAFTDSLAREMEDAGVHVSIIEPGNYKSDIGKNVLARMKKQGYDENSPYKANYERISGWVAQAEEGQDPNGDPQQVAQAALHAMFSENPKRRYLVVPNWGQAEVTIKKQIQELAQLNQNHTYSYGRDELVKMLDEALKENP